MDVLRKELNEFYEGQKLSEESLEPSVLTECRLRIASAVELERDCRVITDASADFCYIFGGSIAYIIGLGDEVNIPENAYGIGELGKMGTADFYREMASSDEDIIYNRLHPEDLVDKRMLEYEFFKFIDTLPSQEKLDYKAVCRLRIKDRNGEYVFVDNSTRILRLSPKGKVWLILCCYALSADQSSGFALENNAGPFIDPCIMNCSTGEILRPELSEKRTRILTAREKEILRLIKEGKLSKEIADRLGISIHTVNRHRQNILEKLSVGNSVEAVNAATMMRLI